MRECHKGVDGRGLVIIGKMTNREKMEMEMEMDEMVKIGNGTKREKDVIIQI